MPPDHGAVPDHRNVGTVRAQHVHLEVDAAELPQPDGDSAESVRGQGLGSVEDALARVFEVQAFADSAPAFRRRTEKGRLRERLGELDKRKPVYVICQSGLRSYIACRRWC